MVCFIWLKMADVLCIENIFSIFVINQFMCNWYRNISVWFWWAIYIIMFVFWTLPDVPENYKYWMKMGTILQYRFNLFPKIVMTIYVPICNCRMRIPSSCSWPRITCVCNLLPSLPHIFASRIVFAVRTFTSLRPVGFRPKPPSGLVYVFMVSLS